MKRTLAGVTERLDSLGEGYHVLNAGQHGAMVVLPLHGRILGLWSDRERTSHFWLNPAFLDSASTGGGDDGWQNPGGHRIWIAPEREFFFADLSDPIGTHLIPASVDPGNYRCSMSPTGVLLESEGVAHAYASNAAVEFALSRQIRVLDVAEAGDLIDGSSRAAVAGYEELVTVQFDAAPRVRAGAWSLVQVPLGGTASAQTKDAVEPDIFLGEPGTALEQHPGRLTIDYPRSRKDCFKIGLAVSAISDRIAYLQEHADGSAAAVIKVFETGEEGDYVDTPWTRPEESGSAVQFYHGGEFGFGEIEVHSGKFEDTGAQCIARLKVTVLAVSGSREECGAAVRA